MKVLDAGMKVKAEVKFSVVLLDVVIKIGDRLAPAPFVIWKYEFEYVFAGKVVLNVVGKVICVAVWVVAAKVPVIGIVFAPNTWTVNVCVFPFALVAESLYRIMSAKIVPILVELYFGAVVILIYSHGTAWMSSCGNAVISRVLRTFASTIVLS